MAALFILESAENLFTEVLVRALVPLAVAVIVLVTAALGRSRVRESMTEFPPAWGTRIVLWIIIALCILMALAAVDVGIYWLAFFLFCGPLLTLWRWPAVICVDEVRIRAVALLRSEVAMYWTEVESVAPSAAGDSLILRSRGGDKIKVPFTQVGAKELVAIIGERTGIECKYEEPAIL